LAVDLDRVRKALRNLDGERTLRNLLERELGYDYEGGLIPVDDLPEDVGGALDGDPKLFASTASEGRITIIYARLNTPGKLSLVTERKIMERLKQSYPYSLYVFSDDEDKRGPKQGKEGRR
jgi:hypothetical protein